MLMQSWISKTGQTFYGAGIPGSYGQLLKSQGIIVRLHKNVNDNIENVHNNTIKHRI